MNNKCKVLNQDTIKYIAMIAMLIGHGAMVFCDEGTTAYDIGMSIGCFAAPTMCYFIVEGYHYTRSIMWYAVRLLICGVIAMLCGADTANMMITLLICLGCLYARNTIKNDIVRVIVCITLVVLTAVIRCDWSLSAPILCIMLDKYKDSKIGTICSFGVIYTWLVLFNTAKDFWINGDVFSAWEIWSYALITNIAVMVSAFTVVFLYNGKRSEKHRTINKWVFYIFYPLHFMILIIFKNIIS